MINMIKDTSERMFTIHSKLIRIKCESNVWNLKKILN